MGKINKFANIYDTNGNLLRHVGEDGKLKNYTTSELEDLVDKLSEDKDENGKVKDPQALNNVNAMLFQYYQKYGNPHEKELTEKLKEIAEKVKSGEATMSDKVDETAVKDALQDVSDSLDKEVLTDNVTDYNPDSYVDFEMVDKED